MRRHHSIPWGIVVALILVLAALGSLPAQDRPLPSLDDGTVLTWINARGGGASGASGFLSMGPPVPYLRGVSTTGDLIDSVAVGSSPLGVAFDSANGNVYVANEGSANVSVVSGATNRVVATVPVGPLPFGAAFDSAKGYVYVATCGPSCDVGPGNVSVIDGSTNRVIGTIPVGTTPSGIAYDSANGDLYVANQHDGTVSVISGATNAVVATVGVGLHPFDLAYDTANEAIYVTNSGSGNVSVISGATNTVIATVSVGMSPIGVAYDDANGDVYVAIQYPSNVGANRVSVISGATNTVVATVSVGLDPFGVAVDSANGHVYVANSIDGTLAVISDVTNTVVANLSLGTATGIQPHELAYDSANGNVYVGISRAGTLGVVPTLTSVSLPTSPVMDVGQTLLLSAQILTAGSAVSRLNISASPGTGLTCRADPPGHGNVSGACQASAPGSYTLRFNATVALGMSAASTLVVKVALLPSVKVALTPSEVLQGEDVTFATVVTGGAGALTYTWSGRPPGCIARVGPTFTCTPTAPGTFHVTLAVRDEANVTEYGLATLIVIPAFLALPASEGYTIFAGTVAMVAVVAVVALYLTRRRRRSRGLASAAPEERGGHRLPRPGRVPFRFPREAATGPMTLPHRMQSSLDASPGPKDLRVASYLVSIRWSLSRMRRPRESATTRHPSGLR